MMGGCQTELFRWPSAELYLNDGDERALMQRGTFTLFLAMHSSSPQLVAVEATVGDVQWPVGKDCEVAYRARASEKSSMHSFTFTLQSLTYELVLGEREGYASMHMDKLQELLSLYTTFCLHGSDSSAKAKILEEEAGKYWMGMAGRFLELDGAVEAEEDKAALQLSLAGKYMQRGTMPASTGSYNGGRGVDAGVGHGTGASGVRKSNIMKRMYQARRISAVSKLFSKALTRGAISVDLHTHVVPSGGHAGGATGADVWPAVADVDVVAKVVDVVEKKATLKEVVQDHKRRSLRGSTWTLNEVGLHLLLKAVVAANMIAAASATSGRPHLLPAQRPASLPPFLASPSPNLHPNPKQCR